jgi:hypothetical protein
VNAIASIVARAKEKNLSFLLAGGHAVIAHGHTRNTFDIDLVVRRSDQQQWTDLVLTLGYSIFREGPTFLQFNPSNDQMLPLDLMLMNEETFSKLAADAVPAPASTGGAKIISLLHLLALKCHAIKHGHEGRIAKDADDVIQLVQVNRLDVNRPDIREIFLKFGTADLYEKVQRTCVAN